MVMSSKVVSCPGGCHHCHCHLGGGGDPVANDGLFRWLLPSVMVVSSMLMVGRPGGCCCHHHCVIDAGGVVQAVVTVIVVINVILMVVVVTSPMVGHPGGHRSHRHLGGGSGVGCPASSRHCRYQLDGGGDHVIDAGGGPFRTRGGGSGGGGV